LCARSVSSATPTGSRSSIRRFIRSHPSAYSTGNRGRRFRFPPLNHSFLILLAHARRVPAFFCPASCRAEAILKQMNLSLIMADFKPDLDVLRGPQQAT